MFVKRGVTPGTYATNTEIQDFYYVGTIAKTTPADPLSKIQTNRIVQNVPLGIPDVAHKKS